MHDRTDAGVGEYRALNLDLIFLNVKAYMGLR